MNPSAKKCLFTEISTLAAKACCKMTGKERRAYFRFQEGRIKEGQAVVKRYKVPVRTYYKGRRKGQMRDVYEVDGVLFEELWKKLYNYAITAARNSHYTVNHLDINVQEDVAEIKYQCFWNLRNFGPKPYGTSFYKHFATIVNNVLTNGANKRNKTLRTKVNYNAISLFSSISPDEDGEETRIIDTLCDESLPPQSYNDLMMDLPEGLQEPVEYILYGGSVTATCKEFGLKRKEFKRQVASIL